MWIYTINAQERKKKKKEEKEGTVSNLIWNREEKESRHGKVGRGEGGEATH